MWHVVNGVNNSSTLTAGDSKHLASTTTARYGVCCRTFSAAGYHVQKHSMCSVCHMHVSSMRLLP
jgi:hypothetical protein